MAEFSTDRHRIEFIISAFGDAKVARDGKNVAVKCPSCGEKKKKFSINIHTWMCHCWVCGIKSKNLYYILKKHIGESTAIRFKSQAGKITIDEKIDDCSLQIVELPENTIMLASYSGLDPDILATRAYCTRRGVTVRSMWYFKICVSKSPQFRRKVIIPSFDKSGKLNYFVSRTIDRNGFPKYINSKVKKTNIIFNEMNIDWQKEVSIVEGPFDLIKSDQNSTCILGSKLSEKSALFNKIVENKTPILLALDADMKSESHKIAKSLSSFGVSVRIMDLRGKLDVGDLSSDEFKKLKINSTTWSSDMGLKYKIRSIKSGSIF